MEVLTDAMGKKLVQSDGHGGLVEWSVGGPDVQLIVVVLRGLLVDSVKSRS